MLPVLRKVKRLCFANLRVFDIQFVQQEGCGGGGPDPAEMGVSDHVDPDPFQHFEHLCAVERHLGVGEGGEGTPWVRRLGTVPGNSA